MIGTFCGVQNGSSAAAGFTEKLCDGCIKIDSRKISEALMKRGVIVRAMNAYGLNTHIRVTIGTRFELMRFVHALKRVLKKGEDR